MKRVQAGDTIVEVLICIAVVSTVLAGAFVVSRQSQIGVRNSQEHAEALKLLESQVEQLRGNAAVAEAYANANPSQPFCMVNASPVPPANCTLSAAPQEAALYKLSVTASGSMGGYLFNVLVQWPEVTGRGTAQESFVYRVY